MWVLTVMASAISLGSLTVAILAYRRASRALLQKGAYDDAYFVLVPDVERMKLAVLNGEDPGREAIALKLENRGSSRARKVTFGWDRPIGRMDLSWDLIDKGESVSFWVSNPLEQIRMPVMAWSERVLRSESSKEAVVEFDPPFGVRKTDRIQLPDVPWINDGNPIP